MTITSTLNRRTLMKGSLAAGASVAGAGAIGASLGMQPSRTSFHLAQLERAGLIESRRESRSIIYSANYERLTAGLTPDLSFMDKLDAQPEFNRATWDYLDLLVSDERVAHGQQLLTQYAPTFAAVAHAYGVDGSIIAAIWGVESNFGARGGTMMRCTRIERRNALSGLSITRSSPRNSCR